MNRIRVNLALVLSGAALFLAAGGTGYAASGADWILGQTNTATTQTSLTAKVGAPALKITDTGTGTNATAAAFNVAKHHAPFTVNSATKVAQLNADQLDGLNSTVFGRAAADSTQSIFGGATFSAMATVTLDAPKPGYVLLQGAATVVARDSSCGSCYGEIQFTDVTDAVVSPLQITSVGSGTALPVDSILSETYAWPVAAGPHTFTLDGAIDPDTADITLYDPTMTALYVPFGGDGTTPTAAQLKTARATG